MILFEDEDMRIDVDVTPEMQQAVFDKVFGFFHDHEVWSGEQVMQCDAPQLDGPEFLAELLDDVLKPTATKKT